jgi:hypothetical protein
MFVVDFIAACLLALVLTVAFAAVLRGCGYSSFRDMSGTMWLMSNASWAGGILLVAFGPAVTGTHWLPFAVAGLMVALLVVAPKFSRAVHSDIGGPGNEVRPAVALYLFITLLLFFCAISLRFYIVHLA